jgi:hypothetical protein
MDNLPISEDKQIIEELNSSSIFQVQEIKWDCGWAIY